MDLDEFLGIDESDPVARLAEELVNEDDRFLGELIELRRRTMTQQEVADRLGISRPAVAAFERYDADPRLSTVRRYALAIRAHVSHTVTPEVRHGKPQSDLPRHYLQFACQDVKNVRWEALSRDEVRASAMDFIQGYLPIQVCFTDRDVELPAHGLHQQESLVRRMLAKR